ncbi:MAG TPA: DmsE family decaheme c-type cytochrome [Noviherbaspirillum sp.]|nr:DmsE family decaheme c-type cytochrome [Noviherbaspirillum sp.]
MKLWQKIVTSVALTLGIAGAGPAFGADEKTGSKDLVLKEDARCTVCHDEADAPKLLHIGKTRHGAKGDGRTPTCTSCHGKSDKHVDYKGKDKPPKTDIAYGKDSKNTAEQRSEACLTCHQGGNRMHWAGSQHASGEVACSSCHQVHTQKDKVRDKATQAEVCFACHKTQRSDANKLSHHPVTEGKVACSSCHNLHGSAGPKLLIKNTVNETCYTCHAEKRGPFLWEHPPATDDCSVCHTPHGSNQPTLLKSRAPFLCGQCHQTSSGHPNVIRTGAGIAATGAQAQVAYKACMNCHTQVHGSNHPSGPRFAR